MHLVLTKRLPDQYNCRKLCERKAKLIIMLALQSLSSNDAAGTGYSTYDDSQHCLFLQCSYYI
jgi:hypothetical protein